LGEKGTAEHSILERKLSRVPESRIFPELSKSGKYIEKMCLKKNLAEGVYEKKIDYIYNV
jgi:hypothetical protein